MKEGGLQKPGYIQHGVQDWFSRWRRGAPREILINQGVSYDVLDPALKRESSRSASALKPEAERALQPQPPTRCTVGLLPRFGSWREAARLRRCRQERSISTSEITANFIGATSNSSSSEVVPPVQLNACERALADVEVRHAHEYTYAQTYAYTSGKESQLEEKRGWKVRSRRRTPVVVSRVLGGTGAKKTREGK
ncbi:hypothetical protein MRX96_043248 [Rhipicephalus microplus]